MSLTTSRGDAAVAQLCAAFGISRQAYYTARKAPRRASGRIRHSERRGPWVSDATLLEKIQRVVAEFPAWGVRKVRAYLRRLGTARLAQAGLEADEGLGFACRRSRSGSSRFAEGTWPCRSRTDAARPT